MDILNDEDLRPELRTLVSGFSSIRACADALGVNHSYLSRVLAGQRPIGATLAHILGYEVIQRYQRTRKAGRPRKEG